MKKVFYILKVIILLLISQICIYSEELETFWSRGYEGLFLDSYNQKSLLAVAYDYDIEQVRKNCYLLDLTNGQTLFSVEKPNYIRLDFSGNRFFVINGETNEFKIYDKYTFELIEKLEFNQNNPKITSNDSIIYLIDFDSNEMNFWNIYKNELTENIKFSKMPYPGLIKFSNDDRYLVAVLNNNQKGDLKVYDRMIKEFMDIEFENFSGYACEIFNNSNKIVFCQYENQNTYLKIFDLDDKTYLRSFKLPDSLQPPVHFSIRNDDKFISYMKDNDFFPDPRHYIYDIENDSLLTYSLKPDNPIIYYNDSIFISKGLIAYKYKMPTTAIENNFQEYQTTFYPNPAGDFIEISLKDNYLKSFVENTCKLQIFNLLGIEVMKEIFQPTANNYHLNLSGLPSGVYYLKLGNESKLFVKE